MAALVDDLLGKHWDRTAGAWLNCRRLLGRSGEHGQAATCSCGSGIPIQKVQINGQKVTLIALPLIFQQFRGAGRPPRRIRPGNCSDTVKVYNPVSSGKRMPIHGLPGT